ncbi:hypothetical protein FRX31_004087 [Thalictrum thalictroides]|uniref:Uncharacterized protein n=1 Tax=Thalictrum thalictroides TaxID=46969 RepID=A0A7J6X960_THATH|nr:hypothetical protein FRX31_004087 [Thalictrum thalictroides]
MAFSKQQQHVTYQMDKLFWRMHWVSDWDYKWQENLGLLISSCRLIRQAYYQEFYMKGSSLDS